MRPCDAHFCNKSQDAVESSSQTRLSVPSEHMSATSALQFATRSWKTTRKMFQINCTRFLERLEIRDASQERKIWLRAAYHPPRQPTPPITCQEEHISTRTSDKQSAESAVSEEGRTLLARCFVPCGT